MSAESDYDGSMQPAYELYEKWTKGAKGRAMKTPNATATPRTLCPECEGVIGNAETCNSICKGAKMLIANLRQQLVDSQQLLAALDNPMSSGWHQRADEAERKLAASEAVRDELARLAKALLSIDRQWDGPRDRALRTYLEDHKP